MNLSPHFTLEELAHSDTALRLGIDNTPPAVVVANLEVLAVGLEGIRSVLGHPMRMLSGYRCEALERVLCAKDFAAWCKRRGRVADEESWQVYFLAKAHPFGWAADWTCQPFGTPLVCVRAVAASGIRFDQLIEEGTWAHSSFDPRLRGNVLTASFAPDGTPSYGLMPA